MTRCSKRAYHGGRKIKKLIDESSSGGHRVITGRKGMSLAGSVTTSKQISTSQEELMDLLKNANARPVHITYVVNDRKPPKFFFQNVVGMSVLRHVEVRPVVDEPCPQMFEGQWSKTYFGFGPETSHFCIQMIYYYRNVGAHLGNSVECLKFHSLRAIARSKALGLPLTVVDEHSFDFISPNGCTIRLVDDDHRRCDPLFETSIRTNNIEETEHFWAHVMGIDIISKTSQHFVLFFGNHTLQIRYVKSDKEVSHSKWVQLAFVVPMEQLVNLNKNIPEDYVVAPLRKHISPERDADFMLILRDPNGHLFTFHDSESWSTRAIPDKKAATRLDLSLHYEHLQTRKSQPNDLN